MPKEILLYGNIETETASQFITAMNEVLEDDVDVRINCNGGNPEYGWGMVAKFAEHPGKKNIKVDGKAYSFGAYFLCYADYSEALDVSKFLFHRAAYPSWFEGSEYFTDALKTNTASVNASLKKALENKIDVAALEAIMDAKPETKGKKFKDIFSMETRLDVFLNAAEAKKIGLINKINKITPEKKAEIESKMVELSVMNGFEIAAQEEIKDSNIKIDKIMTIEKLKAEHPALYAELVAMGVAMEKDRVEAAMVFIDVDPVGVKAAIESGKPLSQKQMADFSLKSMNNASLKIIEKEAAAPIVTNEVVKEKTANEKELADFEAKIDINLGLKK